VAGPSPSNPETDPFDPSVIFTQSELNDVNADGDYAVGNAYATSSTSDDPAGFILDRVAGTRTYPINAGDVSLIAIADDYNGTTNKVSGGTVGGNVVALNGTSYYYLTINGSPVSADLSDLEPLDVDPLGQFFVGTAIYTAATSGAPTRAFVARLVGSSFSGVWLDDLVVSQQIPLPLGATRFTTAASISDDQTVIVGNIFFENDPQNQLDDQAFGYALTWDPGGWSLPQCDSIDFNNDGNLFDPLDIDAFLSVFSEGPCIPETATCNDLDFNNDGSVFDPCDLAAFLVAFSEGPCTSCGL
jgi:hypothetical protein